MTAEETAAELRQKAEAQFRAENAAADAAAEAERIEIERVHREQAEAEKKKASEDKAKAELANEIKKANTVNSSTSDEYRARLADLEKKGLLCPGQSCRSAKTEVTKTISKGNVVIRYRRCKICGRDFTTEEKSRLQ